MRLTTRHILLLAFLVMIHHFAYSSELVPVRLQLKWKHQFQFAGYYAAIERGYYRDVGLDVSILEAQPQKTPFDAVFRGEAEFGVCTTDILSSKNKGETPVVLANIFQHSPHIIIAMQESGIRHIHDLAGKKIAAEPGAADLYAILLSEGVSLDKFSVEELDFSIDKFIAGEVDAITAYSTDQIFPLLEAGYKLNIIYPTNSGVDFYGDLLFTSQALILSNPALVKKFVAASLKGWSYALSNREELVNLIYNKYSKRHSLNHLRFEAEQTWKLILPEVVEIGYTNPGRWETILEMYKRLGRVDESVTLEGMLYADYQKQPFRIPWRLIIILCSALIIAIAFLSFFYRYNKKLKQEIHKRELIQQQLSETNEVLFRTNKEKDKFFSIIAHDLRSPFTAFLGITQVLLEQIDAMELKEIKYYAENLNKSAKNLYRLLENLLQWSCIKQGLSTPQFTTFSINKTVEDILKMFRISVQQKGLSLRSAVGENCTVYADIHMTETILRNLVSNAVKYTPKGGEITISTALTAEGMVQVSVMDTGIGMSEELMSNLFRIDEVSRRPGTEGESSTGLGLQLCEEFLTLIGGSISVISKEGEGSTFSFFLPTK